MKPSAPRLFFLVLFLAGSLFALTQWLSGKGELENRNFMGKIDRKVVPMKSPPLLPIKEKSRIQTPKKFDISNLTGIRGHWRVYKMKHYSLNDMKIIDQDTLDVLIKIKPGKRSKKGAVTTVVVNNEQVWDVSYFVENGKRSRITLVSLITTEGQNGSKEKIYETLEAKRVELRRKGIGNTYRKQGESKSRKNSSQGNLVGRNHNARLTLVGAVAPKNVGFGRGKTLRGDRISGFLEIVDGQIGGDGLNATLFPGTPFEVNIEIDSAEINNNVISMEEDGYSIMVRRVGTKEYNLIFQGEQYSGLKLFFENRESFELKQNALKEKRRLDSSFLDGDPDIIRQRVTERDLASLETVAEEREKDFILSEHGVAI